MFTNKKRAAVDTEWVDANIIAHLPTKSIENVEPLRVSIETWNRMKAVKDLPSVSWRVSDSTIYHRLISLLH